MTTWYIIQLVSYITVDGIITWSQYLIGRNSFLHLWIFDIEIWLMFRIRTMLLWNAENVVSTARKSWSKNNYLAGILNSGSITWAESLFIFYVYTRLFVPPYYIHAGINVYANQWKMYTWLIRDAQLCFRNFDLHNIHRHTALCTAYHTNQHLTLYIARYNSSFTHHKRRR